MKEIIETFFRERSLVNHQIASYDDCIPNGDGKMSRTEQIVRNIRIGTDELVEDDEGGLIKLDVLDNEITIRMKNIEVGNPTIREANGAEHPASPMECRLRKLTYMSPVFLDFTIHRDDAPLDASGDPIPIKEDRVQVGNIPIMVRSRRCNMHPSHIDLKRNLSPSTSEEDREHYMRMLQIKGEDQYDPGGYFIINGTERVLISMEDLAPNRVTVEMNKRYTRKTEVAKIFSQRDGVRKPLTVEKRKDGLLMVKISSAGAQVIPVVLLMRALGINSDEGIFTAISARTDAFKYVVANINHVRDPDTKEAYGVETQEEALGWLEKKFAAGQQKEYRQQRVMNLLDKELLPHLGTLEEFRHKKAIFLGRIVRQVLEMATTDKDPNDKDHYANKRVRLAGDLIEDLFRVSLQQLARDLKYQLERHHNRKRELKIGSCLRPDVLTSKIMHALATGNWVGGRTGVSQLLDRTTFISALSHMRRVTSPLVRSQPHFEARDLHPTQWGRLCPNETPEGQNCGLVKNAAQMIDVSEAVSEDDVKELLSEAGVEEPEDWSEGARVHVNGDIYGLHKDPHKLVAHFKRRRRRGHIRPEVTIRHDVINRDIFINTDKGRILRPLLVIDNGSLVLTKGHLEGLRAREVTFRDLLNDGVVEWVDAEEEEDLLIAPRPYVLPSRSPKYNRPINPDNVEWLNLGKEDISEAHLRVRVQMPNSEWKEESFKVPLAYYQEDADKLRRAEKRAKDVLVYTHVEIDPQLILGVCASLVPYPEHNSTPRVTGGTAMVKQSLGLSSSNYRLRPDTRSHMLHYSQRSIVGTQSMSTTNLIHRPGGQNYIVAVLSHQGYNMQDAVIMNRASVERALGRSTFVRTYTAERRRYPGGQIEEIEIPGTGPDEVKGRKESYEYDHLEFDGLPIPETFLTGKGDDNPSVMVGKTSPPRFLEEGHGAFMMGQYRQESSMNVRHGERGHIDHVFVTESLDSGRLVRITLRTDRIPELGDKFASRHGQKGVVGRLISPEDMPFTVDGVIPDLIINPHAIPSRMTVAHVLEMIGGKVGSMEGRIIDGTAFSGEKEESLREGLLRGGFNHTGREEMINGETGETYPVNIFVGCIYYQKLHHMVSGKIHARSRGRVQILTRQPTEGRARQGGLRFGEMERDCLIAHGASMVIKDRLLDESDGVELAVCAQSGHIAYWDWRRRCYVSPIHGDRAEVHLVQTSYAFKLLLDEMKSLGVAMRLELADRR
jgi:DNA-directed RNA polymerase subunit B